MPARKRKRSYRRRPYARKRRSMASIIRGMAKANTQVGPYGPDSSGNFNATYGPSNSQLRKYPMSVRTGDQNFARVRDRYFGPGDYMQAGEMIGAGLGGVAGAMIGGVETAATGGGGAVFAPGLVAGGAGIGAALGGGLGHAVDVFTGHGDYYGKTANQIVTGSRAPITVNQGQDRTGDIYIQQTEYIGTIQSTTDFNISKYEINPGLHRLFPFLSQLANNYEMYEWEGLMVAYKPLSGEGGDSNALGKVVICTNYDPDASEFKNTLEMQNYDYCSVGKPSQTIIHGIETARRSKLTNMLYVRNDEGTKEKVLTDIGSLYIATEGCPSGSTGVIGELHVTYKVRLSRAKLFASLGNFGLQGSLGFTWNSSSDIPSVLNTQGYKLFERGSTQTNDVAELKVADKDLIAATFLLTIIMKVTSGTANRHHILINDDASQDNGNKTIFMHTMQTASGGRSTLAADDGVYDNPNYNGTAPNSDRILSYAESSGDSVSTTTYVMSMLNPVHDLQDKIKLIRQKVGSASGSDVTMSVLVAFEQIDPLAPDEPYILAI